MGKFLAHADTGILHTNFVQPLALRRPGKLGYPDRHRASGGRKLDGIRQQIQQNLIQAGLVTEYILIGYIHDIHVKFQLLGMNLTADDGLDIMKDIRQVSFRLLQVDFTAFDSAHIQDIIDERKQMITGGQNLGKIIFDFIFV